MQPDKDSPPPKRRKLTIADFPVIHGPRNEIEQAWFDETPVWAEGPSREPEEEGEDSEEDE